MKPDGLYKCIVADALALIAEPEHWTFNAQARDQYGQVCPPWAPQAVRWCFHGAVVKVAVGYCSNAAQGLLLAHRVRNRMLEIQQRDPVTINDTAGQNAAIALAQGIWSRL